MRLEIYDDKKEKFQSWEARIRDDDTCLYDGYGINKNEALKELIKNIDNRIKDLCDFKDLVVGFL